jgi:RNA polymerase sigma-70 factor (ECF subfamily)
MEIRIDENLGQMLADARAGRSASLGALLELYRDHLRLLACKKISRRLQSRVNASDLVQEAFLEASRHFNHFCGSTEPEWQAWLQTILRRCFLHAVQREIRAHKRSVLREAPLPTGRPIPGERPVTEHVLASPSSSPSRQARRREASDALAARLARLPQPMREVLVLRTLQSLPFSEVARQMGRTPGAVRVLWLRALERLRQQTKAEEAP